MDCLKSVKQVSCLATIVATIYVCQEGLIFSIFLYYIFKLLKTLPISKDILIFSCTNSTVCLNCRWLKTWRFLCASIPIFMLSSHRSLITSGRQLFVRCLASNFMRILAFENWFFPGVWSAKGSWCCTTITLPTIWVHYVNYNVLWSNWWVHYVHIHA